MAIFQADADKFYIAEQYLLDGYSILNDKSANITDCTSSYPKGYEYTSDVAEICQSLNSIKKNIGELIDTVSATKEKLMSSMSGWSSTYFESALNNYGNFENTLKMGDDYVNYINQQYNNTDYMVQLKYCYDSMLSSGELNGMSFEEFKIMFEYQQDKEELSSLEKELENLYDNPVKMPSVPGGRISEAQAKAYKEASDKYYEYKNKIKELEEKINVLRINVYNVEISSECAGLSAEQLKEKRKELEDQQPNAIVGLFTKIFGGEKTKDNQNKTTTKINIYNQLISNRENYEFAEWYKKCLEDPEFKKKVEEGKELTKHRDANGMANTNAYDKEHVLNGFADSWAYEEYMTQEQIDVYYYVLATNNSYDNLGLWNGYEAGQNYLEHFEDSVNRAWGQDLGEAQKAAYEKANWVGKALMTTGIAWQQGLSSAFEGMNITTEKILGFEDIDTSVGADEYAAGIYRENLLAKRDSYGNVIYTTNANGEKVPVLDSMNWKSVYYDTNQVMAHMAPSMVASAPFMGIGAELSALNTLTTMDKLLKVAINIPSTVTIWSSSYGNKYKEMINQGYSDSQSSDYAFLSATAETALEKVTSAIPGIGIGAGTPQFSYKALLKDRVKDILIDAGGEVFQDTTSKYIGNQLLGQENDLNLFTEENLNTLLVSVCSSIGMGGGNSISNIVDIHNTKADISSYVYSATGAEVSYNQLVEQVKNGNANNLYQGLSIIHESAMPKVLSVIDSSVVNDMVSNVSNKKAGNIASVFGMSNINTVFSNLSSDNVNKVVKNMDSKTLQTVYSNLSLETQKTIQESVDRKLLDKKLGEVQKVKDTKTNQSAENNSVQPLADNKKVEAVNSNLIEQIDTVEQLENIESINTEKLGTVEINTKYADDNVLIDGMSCHMIMPELLIETLNNKGVSNVFINQNGVYVLNEVDANTKYEVLNTIANFVSNDVGQMVLDNEKALDAWSTGVGKDVTSRGNMAEFVFNQGKVEQANTMLTNLITKINDFRQELVSGLEVDEVEQLEVFDVKENVEVLEVNEGTTNINTNISENVNNEQELNVFNNFSNISEFLSAINLSNILNGVDSTILISNAKIDLNAITETIRAELKGLGITADNVSNLTDSQINDLCDMLAFYSKRIDGAEFVYNEATSLFENYQLRLSELSSDALIDKVNLFNEYMIDLSNLVIENNNLSIKIQETIHTKDLSTSSVNEVDYSFTREEKQIIVDMLQKTNNLQDLSVLSELDYSDKLILQKYLQSGAAKTLLSLTPDQFNALFLYMSNSYKSINSYLDTGNDVDLAFGLKASDAVKLIDEVMFANTIEETCILQRGATISDLEGLSLSELPGKILTHNRNRSTCSGDISTVGTERGGIFMASKTDEQRVKIDYICPKGTKAVNLGMITSNNVESEITIGRNQRIRYDAVKMDGDTACVLAVVLPDGVSDNVNIKDLVDAETYNLISSRYDLNESVEVLGTHSINTINLLTANSDQFDQVLDNIEQTAGNDFIKGLNVEEFQEVLSKVSKDKYDTFSSILSEDIILNNMDKINQESYDKLVDIILSNPYSTFVLSRNEDFLNCFVKRSDDIKITEVIESKANFALKLFNKIDITRLNSLLNNIKNKNCFDDIFRDFYKNEILMNSEVEAIFAYSVLKSNGFATDNVNEYFSWLANDNAYNINVSYETNVENNNGVYTIRRTDGTEFNLKYLNTQKLSNGNTIYAYEYSFENYGKTFSVILYVDFNLSFMLDENIGTERLVNDFLSMERLEQSINNYGYLGAYKLLNSGEYEQVINKDNIALIINETANQYYDFLNNYYDLNAGTTFGVDQHGTTNMAKVNPKAFKELCKRFVSKGLSYRDAIKVMKSLDNTGACSYASVCNTIYGFYKDNPEAFKRDFGFDMFIYNSEHNYYSLNTTELLADLYLYVNNKSNNPNANLFEGTDKIKIVGKTWLGDITTKEQQYMSTSAGANIDLINNYLKSKNNSLNFNSQSHTYGITTNNLSDLEINEARKIIGDALASGKTVGLGIYTHTYDLQGNALKKGNVRFINDDGSVYVDTNSWSEGAGHAVFISSVVEEGVWVSSWGKKLYIPFSDLQNARFTLLENYIDGINGISNSTNGNNTSNNGINNTITEINPGLAVDSNTTSTLSLTTLINNLNNITDFKDKYDYIKNAYDNGDLPKEVIEEYYMNVSAKEYYNLIYDHCELVENNLITVDNVKEQSYLCFDEKYGFSFELKYPPLGGMKEETIKTVKDYYEINLKEKGNILAITRIGDTKGRNMCIEDADHIYTASERAILSTKSIAMKGDFDFSKYFLLCDILSENISKEDKITKLKQNFPLLVNNEQAISSVLNNYNRKSKAITNVENDMNITTSDGFMGKAARWTTRTFNRTGGSTQLTTKVSWQDLVDAGIITEVDTIQVS